MALANTTTTNTEGEPRAKATPREVIKTNTIIIIAGADTTKVEAGTKTTKTTADSTTSKTLKLPSSEA